MARDRKLVFVDVPDVEYARSGEVAIAYQVFGEGLVDLVFARGFAGDLLTSWEQPHLVHQLQSFAAIARVIMLDKRGTGLSDGFRQPPTLETRMDDLRLVMDAVGSERAVLWSAQDGARRWGPTYATSWRPCASRRWCWRRPTGANRRRTSRPGSVAASSLCCRPCEDCSRGSTQKPTSAQWRRPSAS